MGFFKSLIFIAVSMFFISSLAFADTVTLTLEQAIEIALNNSLDIKQAIQDEKIARAKLNQAIADIYMPGISLSAAVRAVDPDTVERGTIVSPSMEADTVEIPVFDGTTGFPTGDIVPVPVIGFGDPVTNQNVWQDNYSLGLSVTKPIFTGFALYNSRRIAEIQYGTAVKKLEDKTREVRFNVKKNFYNLFLLKENLNLLHELDRQLKSTLDFTLANYRAGLVPEYDVIQMRVQYLNNQPALLKMENAYEISKLAFLNLIGMDNIENVEFIGNLMNATNYAMPDITLNEVIEYTKANDINLVSLKANLEMLEISKRLAESARYPRLSGFFNYNYDYSRNPNKESADDPNRAWVGSWNTGLQLSIPIDGWVPVSKTANSIREADANIEKTKIALTQLERALELQAKRLFMQVREASQSMEGQKASMEQASLGLRLANEKYRAGTISNLELNQAEISYHQAKANFLQAVYDYVSGVFEIRRISGIN